MGVNKEKNIDKNSLEFFIKNFLNIDNNSINIIDVYYNQIGRFIAGNLPKNDFLNLNKTLSFRDRFTNSLNNLTSWTFRKFVSGNKSKRFNCIIHVNEISHLREMLPIYNELNKSMQVVFLTLNPNALKVIEENSLDYINPYDFNKLTRFFPFNKKTNLNITGLSEILKSLYSFSWSNEVTAFVKSTFSSFLQSIFTYENILNQIKTDFVIIANDMTPNGRLFTKIAVLNNIKTFSIQHGNIYNDWISQHHIVDTFFTYGNESKNILKEDSKKYIDIVISGSPFINNIISNREEVDDQNKKIVEIHGLLDKYILIALSGYSYLTSYNNYVNCLKSLNKLIADYPQKQFVIKLHPKEKISDYDTISLNQNVKIIKQNNIFNSWKYSIFSWFSGADLLITGSSTCALEAMLMKIPVISIDFENEYSQVSFRKNNISINANDHDELVEKFKNYEEISDLKHEAVSKYVKEFYDTELNSCEIIENTIREKVYISKIKDKKENFNLNFSFLKDAFFYGFGNIISRLVGFILLPLYTQFLSPTDYGIMTLLSFYIIFFGPLSKLGLTEAVFKFIGFSESKNYHNNIYSSAFNAVLLISSLITILSLTAVNFIEYLLFNSDEYTSLIYITILSSFFSSISQMVYTYLKIKRKVKLIFNFNLFTLFFGVIINLYLIVHLKLGLYGAIMGIFLTSFVTSVFSLIVSRVPLNFNLDFNILKEMFQFGLPYVPKHLQNTIMALFCQFILFKYISAQDLGLYAIAWKFCLPLQLLLGMFHNSWKAYKFDLNIRSGGDKSILSSFTFIMIIMYLFSYLVIALFGGDLLVIVSESRFHIAAKYVPILALIPLFNAFELTFSSFVAFGKKQTYQPVIAFSGLVATIVLSFILVPLYGIYGAGISTACGWLLLTILGYFYGQSIFKINFGLNKLLPVIFLLLTVGILFYNYEFIYKLLILISCIILVFVFLGGKNFIEKNIQILKQY